MQGTVNQIQFTTGNAKKQNIQHNVPKKLRKAQEERHSCWSCGKVPRLLAPQPNQAKPHTAVPIVKERVIRGSQRKVGSWTKQWSLHMRSQMAQASAHAKMQQPVHPKVTTKIKSCASQEWQGCKRKWGWHRGDAHLGRPMRRRVRGGCRGRPGSGHLVGGGHHHHVALILGAHVHGLHGAVEVDGGPVTIHPRWHQHRRVGGSARRQVKL